MPELVTISARTTGEYGYLAEIDVRTRRIYEFGIYDEDIYAEPEFLVRATGVVDATEIAALRATSSPRVQQVGLRLYADGVRVDGAIRSWRLSRSMKRPIQEASFDVAVDEKGVSPFGHPLLMSAPLPGMKPVDVKLALRLPNGTEKLYPLITNGLADDAAREDSGPINDSIAIRDAGARYQRQPVDLQLPAGHGLTYAQVVARLAQLAGATAGLPSFRDFQFRKAVTLIHGDWISLATALAAVWGFHLLWDEAGVFTARELAPESTNGPVQGVLNEGDIVRAINGQPETVSIGVAPEAWTQICLKGTQQIVKEHAGRFTRELPFSSLANKALAAAPWAQATDGSMANVGPVPAAQDLEVSSGFTRIEFDVETPVSILSETHGFINPTAARYTLTTSLGIASYRAVRVDANDAAAQARLWPVEQRTLVSLATITREFDARRYLKRVVRETWGYHHKRAYLQSRPNQSTSWEDFVNAPGLSGRLALGNGEGVAEPEAVLRLIERVTEIYDATDDGYQSLKEVAKEGWHLEDGWKYRYGDGKISSDPEQVFREYERTRETWKPVPGQEGLHVYRQERLGTNGQWKGSDMEVREGEPPAAEKRTDLVPSRASFSSDYEYLEAKAASELEQRAMERVVNTSGMPRPFNETQYSDTWAQAPWQLENIGRRLIALGRAKPVSLTILPNPLIREGTWWHLRLRKPGDDLDHDAILLDREFAQPSPGGPIVMRTNWLVFG